MTGNGRMSQIYFVSNLDEESEKPSPAVRYEIQILDSKGGGDLCVFVSSDGTILDVIEFSEDGPVARKLDEFSIPPAVIHAAQRQPVGQGDYVDERGVTHKPF